MRRIAYHRSFLKHFKSRISPKPALQKRFYERLALFMGDPTNPTLEDHPLKGDRAEYRSFSVAGDVRITYKIESEVIRLYDIGSHNQVYR